jgi:hypothetical protein
MAKLKTFFYALRNSLFRPAYYVDVLRAPLSFSVKFFLMFSGLLALLYSIIILTVTIPATQTFITKIKDKAPSFYPKDLEIVIKNRRVSINQEVPYFIPFRLSDLIDQPLPDSSITNLLVIDTQSVNPAKDIREYQTLALLTADSLALHGDQQEIRVFSLDQMEMPDALFNYGVYKTVLDKIQPWLGYLPLVVGCCLVVILTLFFPLAKLGHLVIFSLIAKLLSALFKPSLTYRQTFQIGLQAFALPTLIEESLRFTSFHIPFFYTITFMVFFLLILSKLEKSKVAINP